MEESGSDSKRKQLLKQIQQDDSEQGSAIPKGGQEVTPQAGYVLRKHLGMLRNADVILLVYCRFVVKTTDQDNRKVFINVCGSDKVPMAGGWTDGKVSIVKIKGLQLGQYCMLWSVCRLEQVTTAFL